LTMFDRYRTLQQYVIREFLKIFALSLSSLILIYAVVLFFQKMNLFTKHSAPFYLIFVYLFYKIPEVTIEWILPYAILLATLLTLGTFSRHSEVTAMKAGGVSLYRITFPLVLLALLISFISFIGNEYLIPITYHKTKYLLDVKVRKEKSVGSFKNYKIWYRSDHRIMNIQLLDTQLKTLNGFTLYQFNDRFQCTKRIDAREVKWEENRWWLYDGTVRDFGEGNSTEITPFEIMEFDLGEDWESLQRIGRYSEEMSYEELLTYIRKIQAAGYNATRYLVDLYSKLSTPLLNLIMVLIGIPFALKTSRSGGVALSIGISVMIGFAYAVIFYIFISFGKSGVLHPFIACWFPTIFFGLAGMFTLMSIRQ
jgi:lipopolysaccharide export system permease protein